MLKIYALTVFILLLLGNFIYGDETEDSEAVFRSELAKARTFSDVVSILEWINNKQRIAAYSSYDAETWQKKVDTLIGTNDDSDTNSSSTQEPSNGICAPRIECIPVHIRNTSNHTPITFPICIEVHQCGGCCKIPQFSCVPTLDGQHSVSFFPILEFSAPGQVKERHKVEMMNHTECECKCTISSEQCLKDGKILNTELCQCVKPECGQKCVGRNECAMVEGESSPRCKCIPPEKNSTTNSRHGKKLITYCSDPNQQPNYRCTDCTKVHP